MRRLRPFALACVVLPCIGLILSGSALQGAPIARGALPDAPWVHDVELDADGSLHGVVVNLQGVPIAEAALVVSNTRRVVARSKTDALGRFVIDGLRSGTYQVTANHCTCRLRLWPTGTAPPKTKRFAAIVLGDEVVRGQMPLASFFASDAVIVTGMVAAVIAIPTAVHQSNQRSPTSP